MTSSRSVSYGICSTVRALNIQKTGEAADSRVNGRHDTFNVTADEIVYDISGATAADAVRLKADAGTGEISYIELRINALDPGGTDDADESDGISVDVPALWAIADNVAARTVAFVVYMATAGGPETITNPSSIYFNSVTVTNITFFGGGGVDIDPAGYCRSTVVPGTQVRIDAALTAGGGAMMGNTTIELRDTTDGNITTVVIADTQTTGTALLNITAPGNYTATLGANNTQLRSYEIYNVYGGAYGSPAGFGQYSSNPAWIPQPVTHQIAWDNIDPPGANSAPFTPFLSSSTTAGSFTINWTPIAAGFPDGDFSSYKLYFKKSTDTVWTVIDKNTGGAYANLALIGQGTVTVNGLAPLTNYDYTLSATDLFGNEVLAANRIGPTMLTTAPATITITIKDGITTYNDADFNGDPDPVATHKLRKTNIRVDIEIITSGNMPTQVDIMIADNASDVVGQYGSGANDDLLTATNYTFNAPRSGPNTWTGYIPSENPLMTLGRTIRMIFKITLESGVTYVDHDSELTGDYTDHEWRFYISNEPKFTPYPTKVLNNVITDKNPVAYPSYYLTDDAYVTMTIYDIKGREVAVLIKDVLKSAGNNIKKDGWRGRNKSNKKVGVGLYYIHIKANRVSDGKVILDSYQKVVMAK